MKAKSTTSPTFSAEYPREKFIKPDYWPNGPVPEPAVPSAMTSPDDDPCGLSPTRYGDWVKNGIAVDF